MVALPLVRQALIVGGLAVLCVGCRRGDDLERERQKLDHAVALWTQSDPGDYTYRYTHACYCEQGGRTVIITVRGDSVVAIEDALSGEAVALSPGLYTTVDGLFGLIHDALLRNPDHLEASYDEARGFPRTLSVDYYRQADNDEFGFDVAALEPSSED